jgi:DNA-binding beta-propeller fold protein YncE
VSLLGNVYIADRSNNRIRKVTISTGIISTIAGTGASSYSGDNGAATSAALNSPYGVTVDSSGKAAVVNIFIIYSIFICSPTR